MAIMDMESIQPMVAAAAILLKPAGRFVFSTLHPAFNSGDARPTVEIDEESTTEIYSVRWRRTVHHPRPKASASLASRSSSGTSTDRSG